MNPSRLGRTLGDSLLDLVFPRTCCACDLELTTRDSPLLLCTSCIGQLADNSQTACSRCAARVPKAMRQETDCSLCRSERFAFDAAFALGSYQGLLRDVVLRMKHVAGEALAMTVGELLWQTHGEALGRLPCDVAVPVPMHWSRRWRRRTSPAAVIARVLALGRGIPLAERLARRRRNTQRQFTLGQRDRFRNVRAAFAMNAGYHLDEAHVLLVDDVLTTGATCHEMTKMLKRRGASRVTVVVAARAAGQASVRMSTTELRASF